jgi:short-subunit dehydrogenase
MSFLNKVAIVTGAASGLGRYLSVELASRQARLALFDRDADALEDTARLCRESGAETAVVVGDVSNPVDCRLLCGQAASRFGGIDHLVASAGVSMWARFEDVEDLAIFRRLIEVNYLGVAYCTYYSLPSLRKSGGLITAVSSIQGKIGVPLHTGYVASKHALQGFFAALRTELRHSGVDILLVLPHWVRGTRLRAHAYGKEGKALGDVKTKHSRESITVEECGQAILDAMAKRRRELVIPAKLKALPWLNLISPSLVERLVSRKVDEQELP